MKRICILALSVALAAYSNFYVDPADMMKRLGR